MSAPTEPGRHARLSRAEHLRRTQAVRQDLEGWLGILLRHLREGSEDEWTLAEVCRHTASMAEAMVGRCRAISRDLGPGTIPHPDDLDAGGRAE